MAIEITLTVKSTNHHDRSTSGAASTSSEVVFAETYEGIDGNPHFDALVVREQTARLAEHIATQLDKLAPQPQSDSAAAMLSAARAARESGIRETK